jgi:hypothetical protein
MAFPTPKFEKKDYIVKKLPIPTKRFKNLFQRLNNTST